MEFWPLKTLSEVPGVLLGLQLSPTPNMGVHLGVWGFIPSHSLDSLHSREHVMWLPGLLLGPQPRNLLALVASQMLGLRHWACDQGKDLQRCKPRMRPKSHISCSQECSRMWGNEPTHSQMGSHFRGWTPNGFPNVQRVIVGVKKHWIGKIFIPLEKYWNLDV